MLYLSVKIECLFLYVLIISAVNKKIKDIEKAEGNKNIPIRKLNLPNSSAILDFFLNENNKI